MSDTTVSQPIPVGIPKIQIPVWAWPVAFLGTVLLWMVLQDGSVLNQTWMTLHEFFHDGRHALGLPCH